LNEYIICRSCSFRVRKKTKFCPNCGIRHPEKHRSPFFAIKLPILAIIFHAIFFFIVENFTKYSVYYPFFLPSIGISIIIAALFGLIYDGRSKRRIVLSKKYLKKDEEAINTRIKDIKERIAKIQQIMKQVKADLKSENTQTMLKILDDTKKLFMEYHIKYSGELWKLELIRWKNTLEHIESNWKKADYKELVLRLELLKEAKLKGIYLLDTWNENEYAKSKEGKAIILYLYELIDGCSQFHEAILAREAKLLINDISPLDDKVREIKSVNGTDSYSVLFNAKNDVLTFFTDYEELEKEFDRLEAEKELAVE